MISERVFAAVLDHMNYTRYKLTGNGAFLTVPVSSSIFSRAAALVFFFFFDFVSLFKKKTQQKVLYSSVNSWLLFKIIFFKLYVYKTYVDSADISISISSAMFSVILSMSVDSSLPPVSDQRKNDYA